MVLMYRSFGLTADFKLKPKCSRSLICLCGAQNILLRILTIEVITL
jgi:hypothetical protein